MGKDLNNRAKEIAWAMYLEGLYPWHVKDKLEMSSIPLFEQAELIDMVTSELEKFRELL